MKGRARIEAAFHPQGTRTFGAVLCYESIFIRDHWDQLTDRPWWHGYSPDIDQQMVWRREVIRAIGQDWFVLPGFYSHLDRQDMWIQAEPEGIFMVRGEAKRPLSKPQIGGWSPGAEVESIHPASPPTDKEAIDALIALPAGDPREVLSDGRGDLAVALLAEFGQELYPIRHVVAPLWSCYQLWGFEGWMAMIAQRPDLVRHACQRFQAKRIHEIHEAAALGAAGIWIEDCMTDMISPRAFAQLNLPFLQELVREIRGAGMQSIYYYCGNPDSKWELLFAVGADALSLEESKKGFQIDIEEAAGRAAGRGVLLGNLDAIHLLEKGSDGELEAEIHRQLVAGRRHGGRFIMSMGSPVTPGTSVQRVRRYCQLVHDWAG